jgi:hypothetical protein
VAEEKGKTGAELRGLVQRLGRCGGLKGGKDRAAKVIPEERSESVRKATKARWEQKRREEEAS